jgi:putative ATP-dependent endonuclease of OLD family
MPKVLLHSQIHGGTVRVKSVEIENFRSIRQLNCEFDAVTSFIGPNGGGKSNILRALDWFFNGDKNCLTPDDLHRGSQGDTNPRIRVRVDFDQLTEDDREALGPRYCPNGGHDRFTAWRTWQDGVDKITGRALAYPAFEEIRRLGSASDKRSAYDGLREERPNLELPRCTSAAAVEAAMDNWERSHPDQLSDSEVSDTHFFGVAGQGKLSNLFDFVFVSADMRASEETSGARDSLLSRILQRAVSRDAFDAAARSLVERFSSDYNSLGQQHLDAQLVSLGAELTAAVSSYAPGRKVRLRNSDVTLKTPPAVVDIQISELATETPVTQQGHGFQRTLLLSALTVLSRRRRAEHGVLAIEEPELFQHPTQAKAFASVLRSIAADPEQLSQVAYATHSPHFVNPTYFDEVRRVSTVRDVGSEYSYTRLAHATLESVLEELEACMPVDTVRRRWQQVCLQYLPEALFAESAILVEGEDDAAILEGIEAGVNELAVNGICVAPVNGKHNMLIPFAILSLLRIPSLMVVDNDQGLRGRMESAGRSERDIAEAVAKVVSDNRRLCRFVGAAEEDYPVGAVSSNLAFVPDTMETLLGSDLPGWDLTRRKVVEEGRGVEGKNAATYALAARECEDTPGERLSAILEFCRQQVA